MPREIPISLLAGALGGASAATGFLVLHALTISPIWSSAGAGIAFSAAVGAVLGALLREFLPPRVFAIGFFLWGSLALGTLIDYATQVPEMVDMGLVIGASATYGAAIGRHTRGTRRASIAGAAAAVAIFFRAVPVQLASVRGVQLFAGLLPVMLLFAAVYVLVAGVTARCRDSSPLSPPA
jgi:hypothetical protein